MDYGDYHKLHDASFARAQALKQEYETLRERYDPIIESSSSQADDLAVHFKRLVREAADAYALGQKALAGELARQRRHEQAECERLNDEANRYRRELGRKLEQLRTEQERYRALATAMRAQREGGYRETDDSGWFVTVNYTDDWRYPAGSYYVSYGERGTGKHVSVIYDPDGNYLAEVPPSE